MQISNYNQNQYGSKVNFTSLKGINLKGYSKEASDEAKFIINTLKEVPEFQKFIDKYDVKIKLTKTKDEHYFKMICIDPYNIKRNTKNMFRRIRNMFSPEKYIVARKYFTYFKNSDSWKDSVKKCFDKEYDAIPKVKNIIEIKPGVGKDDMGGKYIYEYERWNLNNDLREADDTILFCRDESPRMLRYLLR